MKSRHFKHNYHDAQLASFTIGPRRELTLEVDIDPVWNKEKSFVSTRFGGIDNFDEVTSFFKALPKPRRAGAYIAEIIALEYSPKTKDLVIIDLADHGQVKICSSHIAEE